MQRDADEIILEGCRRCRNEEVIEESRTAVDALRQPSDGDRLIDAAAVRDCEVGSKERAVASGDGAGRRYQKCRVVVVEADDGGLWPMRALGRFADRARRAVRPRNAPKSILLLLSEGSEAHREDRRRDRS